MLIEELNQGEREGEGEMLIEEQGERKEEIEDLIKELLSAGKDKDRLDKLREFVSCSGLSMLIRTYESDENKGVDFISSFLVWIEIYAHGDGCMLGLSIIIQLLNSIESKHPKLHDMFESSLIHFINCLLSDLDEQLEREDLKDVCVRELVCLTTSPVFLKLNSKTFEFNVDLLMKFSLTVDPYDIPLAHNFMSLLHFLHILSKNQETSIAFNNCMLGCVNFINELCPYILHTEYEWICQLGFQFRRVFVYSKIEGVDHSKKERLRINRRNLLDDSIIQISKAENLMYGVDVCFLDEAGRGDGVLRDWIISLIMELVKISDGVASHGRRTRPFIESTNDPSRILPQPGFVLQKSELHSSFFRCFGRVIGLAIKHHIQLGYTFDPVLFLQLAGKSIQLDDIRIAYPAKYAYYNTILDTYDDDACRSNDLYFPFVFEGEEIDRTKGANGLVNSKNKDEYIHCQVYLEFVESISDAVTEIGDELDDVLSYPSRRVLFRSLTLSDFDSLLRGTSELSLDQWRSYTVYAGYAPNDPEVSWFWECVAELSQEERLELFRFWTATRWLPPGGFGELNPRLVIQMAYSTPDEKVDLRHPWVQTCNHSLSLPRYTSVQVMREMLHDVVTYYSSLAFHLL